MIPKELRNLRVWPGFPAGEFDVLFHFLVGQVRHVCPERLLVFREFDVPPVDSMILVDQLVDLGLLGHDCPPCIYGLSVRGVSATIKVLTTGPFPVSAASGLFPHIP